MSLLRTFLIGSRLGVPLPNLLKRNITYLIDSYFLDGYSQPPIVVSIQPTLQCNLRCKMCGQWGQHGNFVGKPHNMLRATLEIDQWKAIIDEIACFKPNISLWGGEPLLYKDIIELIGYITYKGLRCYLSTNGTLLERYSQHLIDAKITGVQVSIDGPKAIHDEIRGKQGNYEAAIAGIRKIKELRDEKTSSMIITINSIITPWNSGNIIDIIKLAEDSGTDLLTLTLVQFITSDMGRAYQREMSVMFGCDAQSWKGWINDDINAEACVIVEELSKLEDAHLKPSLPVLLSPAITKGKLEDYFYRPATTPYKRCYMPYYEANILPNGDVHVCHNFQDFILGNLTTQKFDTLWNSEKVKEFRKYLQRNLFSICAKCCGLFLCPPHRMLRDAFKLVR